jgi:hypothetical protein
VDFLLDLHDFFSNILLGFSTDYFCKEPKPGYEEQFDTTKQKIAIINRLVEQNKEESLV